MSTNQNIYRNRLTTPREGDDLYDAWKRTRDGNMQGNRLTDLVSDLSRQVAALRRLAGGATSGLHPFKIYQLPLRLRSPDNTPPGDPDNWLLWRVRPGQVTLFNSGSQFASMPTTLVVTGTDGANNPDIETYVDNPSAADTLVPVNCAEYWFWIEVNASFTTATLKSGGRDQANNLFGTDPMVLMNPTDTVIPIGYVDTLSAASMNLAAVRQFIRADVVIGAGGGAGAERFTVQTNPLQPAAIAMFSDYFLATNAAGAVTQIAKPPKLRCSLTHATIYGKNLLYAYPHNPSGSSGLSADYLAYVYRTATVPGNSSENEGVNPQYLPGDTVFAIKVTPNSGVLSVNADSTSPPGTPIVWQQMSEQAWTQFDDPNF